MKKYDFNGLERISKPKAKKIYNEGKSVLFIPCNLNPFSMWGLGIWENKESWGQYEDFETLYDSYTYYNCNSETGKYISFYIEK